MQVASVGIEKKTILNIKIMYIVNNPYKNSQFWYNYPYNNSQI